MYCFGGGSYNDVGEEEDAANMELDEIKCARHADQKSMKAAFEGKPYLSFASKALDILAADWNVLLLKPGVSANGRVVQRMALPRRFTAFKWRKHLLKLAAWGVIEEGGGDQISSTSSYFAVPKTATVGRSIFSGRAISRCLQTPPPARLPHMTDILRKIAQTSQKGPVSVFNADFRHFFHQLSISNETSNLFGVQCKGRWKKNTWRWRSLPMGISWSPVLAQRIGWGVILHREEGSKNWPFVLDKKTLLEETPEFVELAGGGFCFLFYDNFFVIGNDEKEVSMVSSAFEANRKQFKLDLKVADSYSPKMLKTQTVDLLGMQFHFGRKRDREGDWQYYAEWKQAQKSKEKWIENAIDEELSARQLATVIGRIIWRTSIALTPRCYQADVIRMLSKYAKLRYTSKVDWDTPFIHLSELEAETLERAWKAVVENDYESISVGEPHQTTFACSDSSDDRWGLCVFNVEEYSDLNTWTIAEEVPFTWTDSASKYHIFVKEALSAVWTIKRILRKQGQYHHVVLGVDNTAAAAAIRNGYSSNAMVNDYVADLYRELEEKKATIEIVNLRSADNASDSASRGTLCDKERRDRCFKAMSDGRRGLPQHRTWSEQMTAYKRPNESADEESAIRKPSGFCLTDEYDGILEDEMNLWSMDADQEIPTCGSELYTM